MIEEFAEGMHDRVRTRSLGESAKLGETGSPVRH